jgi:hypothetical protein
VRVYGKSKFMGIIMSMGSCVCVCGNVVHVRGTCMFMGRLCSRKTLRYL